MHKAITDKQKEQEIIDWICENDKEFDDAKANGYDLRMDGQEIIYWMQKYADYQNVRLEQLVIPKIAEEDIKVIFKAIENAYWLMYYNDGRSLPPNEKQILNIIEPAHNIYEKYKSNFSE